MKTAKLGAIFLVSVMALAGSGIAYAMWFDYLYIDGEVDTGYIGATISCGTGYDTEPEEKDYSEIYGGNDGDNYIWVYVDNAYPCIDYYLPITITNTGSIPIHVENIAWYYNDIVDDDVGTVEIQWPQGTTWPVQIHPDESIDGTIHIHLNNDAEQSYDYYFYGSLMYHNWNEQVPP